MKSSWLQNNSQLFLALHYSHFLSDRPYSPAIPRIPCVSPETVLLDQVGLARYVWSMHCILSALFFLSKWRQIFICESQNVFWRLFLSLLLISVSSIRLSPLVLVSSLPISVYHCLSFLLLCTFLYHSLSLFSVIPSSFSLPNSFQSWLFNCLSICCRLSLHPSPLSDLSTPPSPCRRSMMMTLWSRAARLQRLRTTSAPWPAPFTPGQLTRPLILRL